jgi:hypothetical protein
MSGFDLLGDGCHLIHADAPFASMSKTLSREFENHTVVMRRV